MNGIISIPVRQTLYNRDCTITIAVGGTEEEKRLFHSVFSAPSGKKETTDNVVWRES